MASTHTNTFYPAGRLVPIFSANPDIDMTSTTLALAKAAAATGETVLMVDCQDGALMKAAGIVYNKTIGDVLLRGAKLKDAQYITSNEHFTAMAAGDATLETILGSLAALSLDYDWVFVGTASGCTPAHVRLAGAADTSLMAYDTASDNFMRAYWMVEACRRRHPGFDPLLMSTGAQDDARETADLLRASIHDFLGAAPPYVGHAGTDVLIDRVFAAVKDDAAEAA